LKTKRGVALAVLILIAAAVSVLVLKPAVPHPHSVISAAPSPSPSAAAQPLRDYGPVPPGVPVIYGSAPSNQLWVTAFDWQGVPRGTLKLAGPLAQILAPEPHCSVVLDQQTFEEVLYVEQPGQAVSKRVGVIVNDGSVGQSGVSAVECNFQHNFAIAVRTCVSKPCDAWVVRLSDAALLGHWSYTDVLSVIPSTDGSIVAENGANGSVTRVRSIPDGRVLATLPAEDAIGAFSDDDRYAVIAPVVSVAPIRVIDWRAKTEVWHYDFSTGRTMMVAVNPGAGDLAIAIGTEEQYYNLIQDYTYSVVIVHADGSANAIPGKYFWIFPPYADAYPPKGGRS
jgi:hypothetical protein